MILQALTEYYEALSARGEISPPGWGESKISFALYINQTGELERIVSVQTEQIRGKKTVLAPQLMSLPSPVKRTVGIEPNFLWDNSTYILGADNKGKPKRAADCFAACKELHRALLDGVDSTAARALLAFFDKWKPEDAGTHPVLTEYLEDILSGVNLVFRCESGYIHNDTAIRQAWERHYNNSGDGPEAICLVTGELVHPENVHPSIKNVAGAQSSGAALVSFNAPAFCSYGKEQNLNAPTGKYAAFAYTTALNHLLADHRYVRRFGDSTVVFWAKEENELYQGFFNDLLMGTYSSNDLRDFTGKIFRGEKFDFDETKLDPNMDFYILGLSPNAARLSVRFFLHKRFGEFINNLKAHFYRTRIVPYQVNGKGLTIGSLIDATVNQHSKKKESSPKMVGELLLNILNDTPYPATLYHGALLRIRAEQEVTWERAAILKAYLLQNYKHFPRYSEIQEVAQMELNDSCKDQAYVLGRLFAVMAKIQLASADWKLNRTITDAYLNSAATTPKQVFNRLFALNQHHMKKLSRDKPGLAKVLDEEKESIYAKITSSIPSRFTTDQTNNFYIGFYHQSMKKKEEN